MANSRLIITFNADVALDETVSFRRKYDDGNLVGPWSVITEQWKNTRVTLNQVEIGTPTGTPGERSAINYMQALQLDYLFAQWGTQQIFTRVANVITIRQSIYWTFDLNIAPLVNSGAVTIEVLNWETPWLQILDYTYAQATTNPVCSHYKLTITLDEAPPTYTLPDGTIVTGNTDNPIVLELPRNQGFTMVFTASDGQENTLTQTINQVPPLLSAAQITIETQATPTGGNAIVQIESSITQVFEYSLNNTDFSGVNTFTNLADGTYTVYVRDAWGCVKSKEFIISAFNVAKPHHFISESMPIRFCERLTAGNCGPYVIDRQRLSYEEQAADMSLVYGYTHPMLNCESRWLQFESNFDTPSVEVIKADGTADVLPTYKRTNNIGLKDRRDALKVKVGTQTGIYFISGNLYDFDTGVDTGDDYFLNGGLPEWAIIGNYIKVDASWFVIVNVVYDELLNAELIIIDTNDSTSTAQSVITSSIYNRQNFEVYEFLLIGSAYPSQEIQLKVLHEDANFTNVEYLSEFVDIDEEHEGTVEVKYWNNKNTDVFYRTGIQLQTRVALLFVEPGSDESQEPLKSDLTAQLLTANNYDILEYNFDSVPKGVYRMLTRALTHQNCYINDEGVIKNGAVDAELQGTTNLMLIKAGMLLTNKPYTTEVTGTEPNIITSDNVLEVPNLIAPEDDAFIGY